MIVEHDGPLVTNLPLGVPVGEALLQLYGLDDQILALRTNPRQSLELGRGPDVVHRLTPGQSWHVTPGTVHRFCAPEGDVRLVEVSTPELDDVVRLDDKYAR